MTPPPVEHTVHIAASVATVWKLLTEPDGLARWWGIAEVDPRPGGRLPRRDGRRSAAGDERHRGRGPRRRAARDHLRVEDTPGAPVLAPGATLVTITLRSDGDGTVLTLRHEGLPPDLMEETLEGWRDVLSRLTHVASEA